MSKEVIRSVRVGSLTALLVLGLENNYDGK